MDNITKLQNEIEHKSKMLAQIEDIAQNSKTDYIDEKYLSEVFDEVTAELESKLDYEKQKSYNAINNKYYNSYGAELEKNTSNVLKKSKINLDKYAAKKELLLSGQLLKFYQTRNHRGVVTNFHLEYKNKTYPLPLLDKDFTYCEVLRPLYGEAEIAQMVKENMSLYCQLVRSASCEENFDYISRLGALDVDAKMITEAFVENLLNAKNVQNKNFISKLVELYQERLCVDSKMMIAGKSKYPMSMVNYYSKKDQYAVGVLESLGAKPRGLNKLLALCVKSFRPEKPLEPYSTASLRVDEKQKILQIKQLSAHLIGAEPSHRAEVTQLGVDSLSQVIRAYQKISPELRSVVKNSVGQTAENIFEDSIADILARLNAIQDSVNADALKDMSKESRYLKQGK